MPSRIARTARIDPRACVGESADIGEGCVIGPDVEVGRGTRLSSHVCLLGRVKLGEFNTIRSFVVIGGDPQDLSDHGAETRVEIGDHNTIAERVTIHRGTEKDDGLTRIGSHNRLDEGVHVAHDCKIADRTSIGIGSMLAGHVHVDSDVTIAEKVGVHQFVTIGGDSFIGGHFEDHPGRALLYAGRGEPARRPGHQRPGAEVEGLEWRGPRRAPGRPTGWSSW